MDIQFGLREMTFLVLCPLLAAAAHYSLLNLMHL